MFSRATFVATRALVSAMTRALNLATSARRARCSSSRSTYQFNESFSAPTALTKASCTSSGTSRIWITLDTCSSYLQLGADCTYSLVTCGLGQLRRAALTLFADQARSIISWRSTSLSTKSSTGTGPLWRNGFTPAGRFPDLSTTGRYHVVLRIRSTSALVRTAARPGWAAPRRGTL